MACTLTRESTIPLRKLLKEICTKFKQMKGNKKAIWKKNCYKPCLRTAGWATIYAWAILTIFRVWTPRKIWVTIYKAWVLTRNSFRIFQVLQVVIDEAALKVWFYLNRYLIKLNLTNSLKALINWASIYLTSLTRWVENMLWYHWQHTVLRKWDFLRASSLTKQFLSSLWLKSMKATDVM